MNKVILVGNLGQDPEIKKMTNGDCVTIISIATSEEWKDKNTGQKQAKTDWHRVTAYGKTGEIIGRFCRKGSKVYVEAKLKPVEYINKEGAKTYGINIIANTIELLDPKKDDRDTAKAMGYDEHGDANGNRLDDEIPF